jgi:hypothetical protein
VTAVASRAKRDTADLGADAIAAVEDALRALAKAHRSAQLYLPNNPTRIATFQGASASFARVWQFADPLHVEIHETTLLWKGRVVYDDTERGTEGFPWLMYRDGLRLLTLRAGFEQDEIEKMLGVFHRAKAASTDEDDLVTLLWVADLSHVTYHHVETTSSAPVPTSMDVLETAGAELLPLGVTMAESTPVGDGPPPGVIRIEDFDDTLYFLEPKETTYLEDEIRREYTDDPRHAAVAAIYEIVAMRIPGETRAEALRVIDALLLEFLSASDFEMVAVLLRDAAFTRQHLAHAPEADAALAAFAARLSEPAVMRQLLQAFDESTRAPSTETLETLFGELHPAALQSLLGWLGAAQPSLARAAVERASLRLARENTVELTRLLEHPDSNVVHGALRIAMSLATPAVVPALARLLAKPDRAVRAEAVNALREIGTSAALQALEGAIGDEDREVRVATLRAIAVRKHAAALPKLLAALKRKELRSADLGEKMALFEAYGTLCGNGGVAELDALLNARGIIGPREPTEMRACAARALGLIGTSAARAALQRAADSKDMVVRSAVTRAQRGAP